MYTIDFSSIEFVDDVGSSFASLLEAQMEYGFISQIRYEQLPPNMKMLVDKYNEEHKKSSNKLNSDNGITHASTHAFGDNITSAINYSIEQYDKASDELVLQSECLVEAYNKMIRGKVADAMSLVKKKNVKYSELSDKQQTQAGFTRLYNLCEDLLDSIADLEFSQHTPVDIKDSDIEKLIVDSDFYPSDNDPEKVKRIINARIRYNNTIMEMFKMMIYNNYEILGLSKDVAMVYNVKLSSSDHSVQKEAVKDIKQIIETQTNKFKLKGHNTFDFRPLGLGVLFQTEEYMGGVSSTYTDPSHYIQVLSQYDCVVIAHGGDEEADNAGKLRSHALDSICNRRKTLNDKMKEISSQIQELTEYIESKQDQILTKLKLKENNGSDAEKFAIYVKKCAKSYQDDMKDYQKDIDKFTKRIEQIKYDLENDTYSDTEAEQDRALIKRFEERIKETTDEMSTYEKGVHKVFSDFLKVVNNTNHADLIQEYENVVKPTVDKTNKDIDRCKKELERIQKQQDELDKESYQSYKTVERHIDKNKYWSIQTIYTLNAGPFTKVDDLVRQLIKEGFKKIFLINCNPGGHKLPKDITQKEGITIRMSKTNTLVESACETVDPYEQIHLDIENSQLNMAQICESFNINYWDDISLNEMANDYNNTLESMNEGTLKNIWTKIKELIKKAVAIVVNLVKRLFDIIKTFIDKIKAWFKRLHESKKYDDKFKKSVKTSVIIVENASVDKFSANNWDDLENKTIKACSAIQKKIDELQNKQLKNYKELDKYADQMSKTANESSISELDSLVNMLW